MRRALLAVPILVLLALAPSAGAQSLPPCGPEELRAHLSTDREMYATHRYFAELTFERPEGSTVVYDPVNVRAAGPPGVVRRFRFDGTGAMDVVPQAGGPFAITVTWDQQEYDSAPACSGSATFDLTARDALPVVIRPVRRRLARLLPGPGYGFTLRFEFATQGPSRNAWHAADMTPLRVEARAVKRARRPSRALAPAVIEFPPGEPKVKRDTQGVVQVRRARPQGDPYMAEVFVRTRKGRAARGLTVDVSQGARLLGRFTLVGRCSTRIVFGGTFANCRFRGRQPWLLRTGPI
jgi:hypothetical protein